MYLGTHQHSGSARRSFVESLVVLCGTRADLLLEHFALASEVVRIDQLEIQVVAIAYFVAFVAHFENFVAWFVAFAALFAFAAWFAYFVEFAFAAWFAYIVAFVAWFAYFVAWSYGTRTGLVEIAQTEEHLALVDFGLE